LDVVAREGETSGSKPLAYPVIVEAPVKTATEARQGRVTGVVRWVLGLSPDARNHRHDPMIVAFVGFAGASQSPRG
jgi:hypothetical protein